MTRIYKIFFALFLISIVGMGCQKNFYSGKAKSNDCGCPNKKGMVGY